MHDQRPSNPDSVGDAVKLLRILADPTRLRLLGMLQSGELNVSALCEHLSLAQPTVSHHLGLLRSVELVNNRRDGKQVFYSLNTDMVSSLERQGGLTISAGPVEVTLCDPEYRTEPVANPAREETLAAPEPIT